MFFYNLLWGLPNFIFIDKIQYHEYKRRKKSDTEHFIQYLNLESE